MRSHKNFKTVFFLLNTVVLYVCKSKEEPGITDDQAKLEKMLKFYLKTWKNSPPVRLPLAAAHMSGVLWSWSSVFSSLRSTNTAMVSSLPWGGQTRQDRGGVMGS